MILRSLTHTEERQGEENMPTLMRTREGDAERMGGIGTDGCGEVYIQVGDAVNYTLKRTEANIPRGSWGLEPCECRSVFGFFIFVVL
jgi:hypothetical protein